MPSFLEGRAIANVLFKSFHAEFDNNNNIILKLKFKLNV